MNYFKALEYLVSSGQLEILYIISPPRTFSTVLEIALAEYGHGQIHEPFHKRRRVDFNDGCRIVHDRFLKLSNENKERPVKLVIKDLSKFVNPDEWKTLIKLAKNFVFTIREPSRQIFSMASRYANDLDNYDVDNLTHEQILINLPRIPFEDLAFGYWENLLELFNITKDHVPPFKGAKNLVVVSGATFRYNILDSLSKLVEHLNLDVDPNKLLKNWTVGTGSNFYRPEYIVNKQTGDETFFRGAWLGPALSSTTFQELNPKHDFPKDIDIYDNHLQRYFLDNILPVYVRMYLDDRHVCKPDIRVVTNMTFSNSLLVKSSPIEAYLLCNSFPEVGDEERRILKINSDFAKQQIIKFCPLISKRLFRLVSKYG